MDELIDILNADGKPCGETCMKSFAHKNGLFHASVHIWIFDEHNNVLIQKRKENKDTFPNFWDISVAGHISAGEQSIISAIREIEEEIGLSVTASQLEFIDTFKKKIIHSKELIDNELHYIYMCKLNFKLSNLKIQKEEVSALNSIKLVQLKRDIKNSTLKFVPHGADYFKLVFKAIKKYNI
ncbi:NUDIX domain-containing protein [Lutibacter sp. TH_r2]|uniref:NUDIX hydrolase n=1 Tax=Lutibacter sp. TH_r2 TaxID=3082083 RepID=UPI0029556F75|nr:NUDIX domain-containing protein [Lutibacter sp. TH_r2]MDV7188447.1 NUDIX domain-containing protein [Lutibacter sp. TH_r2]